MKKTFIAGGVKGFTTNVSANESVSYFNDLKIGDMFQFLTGITSPPRIGVKISDDGYVMFNPAEGTLIMTNHSDMYTDKLRKLELVKLETRVASN